MGVRKIFYGKFLRKVLTISVFCDMSLFRRQRVRSMRADVQTDGRKPIRTHFRHMQKPFGERALVLDGHVGRYEMIDVIIEKRHKLFFIAEPIGKPYLQRDYIARRILAPAELAENARRGHYVVCLQQINGKQQQKLVVAA